MIRRLSLTACVLAAVTSVTDAIAFPYVMKPTQTLVEIAGVMYGDPGMERVLVAANVLETTKPRDGLRLEIPAVAHRRAAAGDTWAALAAELLGHADRADVLSAANDSSPWKIPTEGAELIVPYNLRVTVGPTDSLVTIALRFTGRRENAWILDKYNRFGGTPPKRGDLVLVPLSELRLTDEGKRAARAAGQDERSEAEGTAREAQKKAETELPALLGDVRMGRYLDAAVRGLRVLSYGELSREQLAQIHRALLDTFVALDARGHAGASCRAFREAAPDAPLDPVYTSPKVLAACEAVGVR